MAPPRHPTMSIVVLMIIFNFLAFSSSPAVASKYANVSQWLNHGGDLYNRRYAEEEVKISPKTASKLKLKWEFFAGNNISATPAIFEGVLYFPSWNGNIYAVKAHDGSLVWKKSLGELTGFKPVTFLPLNTTISHATPTVTGNLLIITIYGPSAVIAVNRATGKLVWTIQLDDQVRMYEE